MRYLILSSIVKRNVASAIIFISLWFGIIYNLHANTNKDANHSTQDKQTQHKVQVKGDTLIIQDGSCQSQHNTLASKLNTKDSKQTMVKECDEPNGK